MSVDVVQSNVEVPAPRIEKMRWPFPLIWIVPFAAACASAWFLFDRYQGMGPEIRIRFVDVGGVKPGETPVEYRGVPVGLVQSVGLSEDLKNAVLTVRLQRSAESLAKKGSRFWLVRPELGQESISGLGTIFSGPYLDVQPGEGPPERDFEGLAKAPLSPTEAGLRLRVSASHMGTVSIGSPVYFRGVRVGNVERISLSKDATRAEAHVVIAKPYASLVRRESRFWRVAGADVRGSLFGGVDVKVESLRSLVLGGISFATPDDAGSKGVPAGADFDLADEPKKEWLEWSPRISLSTNEIRKSEEREDASTSEAIGPALIKREK